MDLNSNCFRPYKKPNSETIYMSKQSNHPYHVKKQIPSMVNNRLNRLSKNESDFNFVKKDYQNALDKSQYNHELNYSEDNKHPDVRNKKRRRRKIIYFQPPFSLAVKTPIGKRFLHLVKKHFTPNHPLYKILNHRCLKISYCCMNNIKNEITSCNKRLRSDTSGADTTRLCNCRSKEDPCPLGGKCLLSNIVYRADIETKEGDHKIYIGTAGNTFKERHGGHKSSMKHRAKRNTTELSKAYWTLKDEGKTPVIKWSVVKQVKTKYNLKRGCTLCNTERYEIARANKDKLLNKRNERKRVCPHYTSSFF